MSSYVSVTPTNVVQTVRLGRRDGNKFQSTKHAGWVAAGYEFIGCAHVSVPVEIVRESNRRGIEWTLTWIGTNSEHIGGSHFGLQRIVSRFANRVPEIENVILE